jgi:hypothetical protein
MTKVRDYIKNATAHLLKRRIRPTKTPARLAIREKLISSVI